MNNNGVIKYCPVSLLPNLLIGSEKILFDLFSFGSRRQNFKFRLRFHILVNCNSIFKLLVEKFVIKSSNASKFELYTGFRRCFCLVRHDKLLAKIASFRLKSLSSLKVSNLIVPLWLLRLFTDFMMYSVDPVCSIIPELLHIFEQQ